MVTYKIDFDVLIKNNKNREFDEAFEPNIESIERLQRIKERKGIIIIFSKIEWMYAGALMVWFDKFNCPVDGLMLNTDKGEGTIEDDYKTELMEVRLESMRINEEAKKLINEFKKI